AAWKIASASSAPAAGGRVTCIGRQATRPDGRVAPVYYGAGTPEGAGPGLVFRLNSRQPEQMMLYTIGMVLAGIGAATLIGALTYVTLMLTGVILSMVTLTASPVVDRVFKEK